VFTWARLVEPHAPKEVGEPLFKEANAPARRPDEVISLVGEKWSCL